MKVREITLDGFKSFATRVSIGPFDDQFTAITGPNGSGKSNILDALCFVMGINRLQQIRATKLEDLIFKQGQAGVTRASVTLLLDNTDKHSSPPSLIDKDTISVSRQVIVGGKDKYFLNGHVSTVGQVSDVFKSARLNVNNPQFLVMQGRIVKVINMKPTELMNMMEETSGTKQYDEKREKAQIKLKRKQEQLDEIERILAECLEPTIAGLRRDKEEYIKWMSLGDQLQELKSVRHTKKCMELENKMQVEQSKMDSLIEELENIEIQKTEIRNVITGLTDSIEQNTQTLKERKHNKEAKEMRGQLEEFDNDCASIKGQVEEVIRRYENEKKELRSSEKALRASENELQEFENREADTLQAETSLKSKVESIKEKLKNEDAVLTKIRAGKMISEDGGGEDLGETRKKIKSQITSKVLERSRLIAERGELQNDIKKLKDVIGEDHDEEDAKAMSESLNQRIEGHARSIASQQNELAALGNIPELQIQSVEEYNTLRTDMSQCEANVKLKESELHRSLGRFMTLIKDKQQLHGPAFSLFEVKEDCKDLILALEEAGRTRLLQLVVRDDGTATELLKRAKCDPSFKDARITCIPLNRIVTPEFNNEKLSKARNLSSSTERVLTPLECIQPLSPSFEPALKYVFGLQVICDSSVVAQQIAFSQDIKLGSISRNGDVYNPAGSLSGGGNQNPNQPSLLKRVEGLLEARRQLDDLTSLINAKEVEVNKLLEKRIKYDRLKDTIETEEKMMHNNQLKLKKFVEGSLSGKLQSLKQQNSILETKLSEVEGCLDQLHEQDKALESTISNFEKTRDLREKQCRTEIDTLKIQLRKTEKELTEMKESTRSFNEEHIRLKSAVELCRNDTRDKETTLAATEAEMNGILNQSDAKEHERHRVSSFVIAFEKETQRIETHVADLKLQLSDSSSTLANLESQSKRKEDIKGIEAAIKELRDGLKHMKGSGGLRELPQQYKNSSLEDIETAYNEITRERAILTPKINKQAISMLQNAEAEIDELQKKCEHVRKQRDSITEFIEFVDSQKRETLLKCHSLVARYTDSIYSTLLPNARASLAIIDSNDLSRGVQLQVAIRGVWKSSLGELSGGQKSLLALSLILGLLKFNPAPFYILDEVDAALDLSHTQNMGRMIKTFFKESQFIVVSLKENLFENARVLFRTKFHHGVSDVTRYDNEGDEQQHLQQEKAPPHHRNTTVRNSIKRPRQ